jgi:hypothetical protein
MLSLVYKVYDTTLLKNKSRKLVSIHRLFDLFISITLTDKLNVGPSDRRKVLRHHPDKKASQGGESNDDSFFKCIAKGIHRLFLFSSR